MKDSFDCNRYILRMANVKFENNVLKWPILPDKETVGTTRAITTQTNDTNNVSATFRDCMVASQSVVMLPSSRNWSLGMRSSYITKKHRACNSKHQFHSHKIQIPNCILTANPIVTYALHTSTSTPSCQAFINCCLFAQLFSATSSSSFACAAVLIHPAGSRYSLIY